MANHGFISAILLTAHFIGSAGSSNARAVGPLDFVVSERLREPAAVVVHAVYFPDAVVFRDEFLGSINEMTAAAISGKQSVANISNTYVVDMASARWIFPRREPLIVSEAKKIIGRDEAKELDLHNFLKERLDYYGGLTNQVRQAPLTNLELPLIRILNKIDRDIRKQKTKRIATNKSEIVRLVIWANDIDLDGSVRESGIVDPHCFSQGEFRSLRVPKGLSLEVAFMHLVDEQGGMALPMSPNVYGILGLFFGATHENSKVIGAFQVGCELSDFIEIDSNTDLTEDPNNSCSSRGHSKSDVVSFACLKHPKPSVIALASERKAEVDSKPYMEITGNFEEDMKIAVFPSDIVANRQNRQHVRQYKIPVGGGKQKIQPLNESGVYEVAVFISNQTICSVEGNGPSFTMELQPTLNGFLRIFNISLVKSGCGQVDRDVGFKIGEFLVQ